MVTYYMLTALLLLSNTMMWLSSFMDGSSPHEITSFSKFLHLYSLADLHTYYIVHEDANTDLPLISAPICLHSPLRNVFVLHIWVLVDCTWDINISICISHVFQYTKQLDWKCGKRKKTNLPDHTVVYNSVSGTV